MLEIGKNYGKKLSKVKILPVYLVKSNSRDSRPNFPGTGNDDFPGIPGTLLHYCMKGVTYNCAWTWITACTS